MRNAMDAEEVAVGWWPGDGRHDRAAFYAYAHPAPESFAGASLPVPGARWDAGLGDYLLDLDDVRASPDPRGTALDFARAAFQHACAACGWDGARAASSAGNPQPVSCHASAGYREARDSPADHRPPRAARVGARRRGGGAWLLRRCRGRQVAGAGDEHDPGPGGNARGAGTVGRRADADDHAGRAVGDRAP